MAKYTYAISNGGCIKIGRTNDVPKRLASLQTASPYPLTVYAVFTGDREAEAHRRLDEKFGRLSGEWFEDTLVVREEILLMGFRPTTDQAVKELDGRLEEELTRGIKIGWKRGHDHAMEAMQQPFDHPEEHW